MHFASRWAPPVVWAGFILMLTSWPSSGLPSLAVGMDKVGHFGLYGVLGFLVGRALRGRLLASALAGAALGIAAFGALDEWHQLFVPGRAASVWDWVADVAGTLVGLLSAHFLFSQARTRRDPTS